jgi:hypothetical protein
VECLALGTDLILRFLYHLNCFRSTLCLGELYVHVHSWRSSLVPKFLSFRLAMLFGLICCDVLKDELPLHVLLLLYVLLVENLLLLLMDISDWVMQLILKDLLIELVVIFCYNQRFILLCKCVESVLILQTSLRLWPLKLLLLFLSIYWLCFEKQIMPCFHLHVLFVFLLSKFQRLSFIMFLLKRPSWNSVCFISFAVIFTDLLLLLLLLLLRENILKEQIF